MMRASALILLLTSLTACVAATDDAAYENLTKARRYQHNGNPYIVQFSEFGGDFDRVSPDGEAVRVYMVVPIIAVSRGSDPQFVETDEDQREARTVAVAYCKQQRLFVKTSADADGSFSQAETDNNAEWRFSDLCSKPPLVDEVAQ